MKKKYYNYSGIIHVHSSYSDGKLTVEEIAAIANELPIDYLLITDHNTLQAKFDGKEGWHERVLVGIGCELNDSADQNHYLAFDIDKEVDNELAPHDYVRRVSEQGGFGIIAHPDEARTHIAEYPPYPWKRWDNEEFEGIEIWNQMSEWMEGLTHKNKYWRALHPRRSIVAPKKETLARWDALNKKRKVVGIGGVDAHEHIYRLWGIIPIRIFRYKVSFRTIRTHILTEQPLERGTAYRDNLERVYRALRNGHSFIAHNYFGDAGSFRFWAENGSTEAIIGETISLQDKTVLHVKNPRPAQTRLLHNGKMIAESDGIDPTFSVSEPGVYRVESHIEKRPWILSNHIRVEQESSASAGS